MCSSPDKESTDRYQRYLGNSPKQCASVSQPLAHSLAFEFYKKRTQNQPILYMYGTR